MYKKGLSIFLFFLICYGKNVAGNLTSIILQSSVFYVGTIQSADSLHWKFQRDSNSINSSLFHDIYFPKSSIYLQKLLQSKGCESFKIILFIPSTSYIRSDGIYKYYLDYFIVENDEVTYDSVKYSLSEFITSITMYKEQNHIFCSTYMQGNTKSKLIDAFSENSTLRKVLIYETKERCFDELSKTDNSSAVISASKMNILYEMAENPLEIAIPNRKNSEFYPKISRGEIIKRNGTYYAIVNVIGKATITLLDSKTNDSITSVYFRVKSVPLPVACILGREGGLIAKELLLVAKRLDVRFKDFDFDIVLKVRSYTVTIQGVEYKVENNTITDEVKDAIRKLEPGQKLFFDDIKVVFLSGVENTLSPILFKIQ